MKTKLNKNDIMDLSSDIVDMFDNYLYVKGSSDSSSLSKEDYRSLCDAVYNQIKNQMEEDD